MDRDASVRPNLARHWAPGICSALLLWLSFPPVGWWPLAWLAPCGWLWWAGEESWNVRRPYLGAYVSGALFWLPYLQGIRLAHVALIAGWLALALYLAVYTPLFIATTRGLVRFGRLPLPLAGAIAWVFGEYLRSYVATGFGGGMLAHSQTPAPELIQSAEWCGVHGLGFLMVFVSGCLVAAARKLLAPADDPRRGLVATAWSLTAATIVAANAWFGTQVFSDVERETDEALERAGGAALRVALIQESVDTIFEFAPDRARDTFETYRQATLAACRAHGPLDLIVWPESVFTAETPDYLGGDPRHPELRRRRLLFADKLERLAREINGGDRKPADPRGTWLIVGTATVDLDARPPHEFNSALLIDPDGHVAGRYYKSHLVMFGEYLPGGAWFPSLYALSPMPNGLTAGTRPEAFAVGGVRLSPSICFESMVPQLVRRQLRQLAAEGTPADALVNVTNDGWFWGSSILDTHFQAALFRAVEHRRPLLVAANTGISCVVAPSGRVVRRGEHRRSDVLVATIGPAATRRGSFQSGDRVPGICIIVGIGAVFAGFISQRRDGRSLPQRKP